MRKIIVDTKGADKGANELIKGGVLALEKHQDLQILFVGDSEYILNECQNLNAPMQRIEVLNAPEEITNYDNPALALFNKTQSSMIKGLCALGEREDLCGMITAGNTGVLISATVRFLPSKNRVRPVLSAVLPAQNGAFTCLVDTGATIDCNAEMLLHFARLGSAFMKNTYKIQNPKVGLLSNGAEPTKGNKVVKEAHLLLKDASDINFIGNIEGNNALSGDCDVLVCDGFAGNQVLKVTEGTATRIITDVVKYAKRTQSKEIMGLVGHLMGIYDISSLGGGIILGPEKPIIKIRGSAGGDAIVNTSRMILNIAENKEIFDSAKNNV